MSSRTVVKRMRYLFLIMILLFPAGTLAGDVAVTEDNWVSHPLIREVREVYREIKDAQASGKLETLRREFEYCEPYEDTERTIHRSKNGTVRAYEYSGGSDDSALNHEFYYDRAGTLRFAFITGGAVNGTRIEHRIYFDSDGKRIWEVQKLLEGPGYTFPKEWPEDALVREPLKAFNAPSPCPEAVK